MEQHRTRPPNDGRRRGAPLAPLPPQARRPVGDNRRAPGADAESHPARDGRPATSGPAAGLRLTALGGGLFCAALMFLLGYLDHLLFGGSLTLYGVLFLPVCVLTALWVRGGDLLTAPVVVPIAFAVGLLPVADGSGGVLGRLMGLVTGLATQAGWLYGGTLVAGVIVLVRRVLLVRATRRRRA
ncbi:hypothetical protein KUM39_01570 [Streptomyces sp. J2-1]|uniref:DUF6542 domain-containing protein n=1 Tax=Streptomyces corallincola TaxID=2851888 RepID=UPI001C38186F|nr:DUF6542 domain-containing protein [Streptomyces corallincola]MBV2353059.1 hypothetical protein [Streptomyces corallincola]